MGNKMAGKLLLWVVLWTTPQIIFMECFVVFQFPVWIVYIDIVVYFGFCFFVHHKCWNKIYKWFTK